LMVYLNEPRGCDRASSRPACCLLACMPFGAGGRGGRRRNLRPCAPRARRADKAPRPPVERCRSCFHFLMSRAHAVAVARGFPLLLGCRPRQPAWKTAAESGGCTAAAPSDVAAVWALCFFSHEACCCVRGSDRPLGKIEIRTAQSTGRRPCTIYNVCITPLLPQE